MEEKTSTSIFRSGEVDRILKDDRTSWFTIDDGSDTHNTVKIPEEIEETIKHELATSEYPIDRSNIDPRTIVVHASMFKNYFVQKEIAQHVYGTQRLRSEARLTATSDVAQREETYENIRKTAREEPSRTARNRTPTPLQRVVHRVLNRNLLARYERLISTNAKQAIRENFDVSVQGTKFSEVIDFLAQWVDDTNAFTRFHALSGFRRRPEHSNMRILADAIHDANTEREIPTIDTLSNNTSTDTTIANDRVVAAIFKNLLSRKEEEFFEEKLRENQSSVAGQAATRRSLIAIRSLFRTIPAEQMPQVPFAKKQKLNEEQIKHHAIYMRQTKTKSRKTRNPSTDSPTEPEPKKRPAADDTKITPSPPKKTKRSPKPAVYKDGKMVEAPKPFHLATISDINNWKEEHGAYIFSAKQRLPARDIKTRLEKRQCLNCDAMLPKSGRPMFKHLQNNCTKATNVATGANATKVATTTPAANGWGKGDTQKSGWGNKRD